MQGDLDTLDLHAALRGMEFDKVLALDVIEHLKSPETFLERIGSVPACRDAKFLFTVPNVAFVAVRFMLAAGQFNYGRRGILDRTHTRLFTFSSLRQSLEQSGLQVLRQEGIPAPFPLALADAPRLGRALINLNLLAIRLWKRLFSYQIFCQATPYPHAQDLLEATQRHSDKKHACVD